ncbi:Nudix family hydrolase [Pseudohongiella sp. O18]|uniref:Nudix family hydrolase n=1 Tax=Pseudohongiella sp. O18 TaxID=2904248 RepID=UPI001F0080E3|nr:Nudix family hydrolase [Pseudohongiella sp. O18]
MTDTATAQTSTTVHVAVGVILGTDGKILITQRHARQHLGGYWEFPGGKVEPDESVGQALARELLEELNIRVISHQPLCRITHHYPDKSVLLDVHEVIAFEGEPRGMENQPMRWLDRRELRSDQFPAANRAIIRALHLPDHVMIYDCGTPAAEPLPTGALANSALVRLRRTDSDPSPSNYCAMASKLIQRYSHNATDTQPVRFLLDTDLNSHPETLQLAKKFPLHVAGFYLNSHAAKEIPVGHQLERADDLLLGTSCHSEVELHHAAELAVDFAIVSPVLPTTSHPGKPGTGWPAFSQLASDFPAAVYAMGGMQLADLETAKQAGARGIAGISMYRKQE